MGEIILSHYSTSHMKGVDLFRFILVNTNNLDVVKRNSSRYTLFLTCSCLTFHLAIGKYITCVGIESICVPILKKIPSDIHASHNLEQLILKYNFKLFFLFMNKWFIAAGVD